MKKSALFISFFVTTLQLIAQTKDPNEYSTKVQGFLENKGQIVDQNFKPNPDVKYLLNSPGFNIQLRQTGFSYDTYGDVQTENTDEKESSYILKGKAKQYKRSFHRVDVELMSCNPSSQIIPEETKEVYINYFTAGCPNGGISNVILYEKVIYKNIYPNIDLEFLASSNNKRAVTIPVEYQFIVHPGGNTADIKLKYTGANKINLKDGKIVQELSTGIFSESIPSSFLKDNHEQVKVQYSSLGDNVYGFSVPSYSPKTSDLIIDPVPTLVWGTYFGGSALDNGAGIALDAAGNVCIAGNTNSSTQIATAGVYQGSYAGFGDAFIAKFDPTGSTLLWATYYGGALDEICSGIALDASNNIYIVGSTESTTGIATPGAYQTSIAGNYDVFVAKFNPTGTALLWGTYYGGTGREFGHSIAVNSSGEPYITGQTNSLAGIATAGAYRTSGTGVFVAKFNNSGTSLSWGTFYGTSNIDYGSGIALDASDNVYITGSANQISTTPGAYKPFFSGGNSLDAFAAKFNPAGTSLLWGTYYGTPMDDEAFGITVDASNNVYITGATQSTSGLATAGAYQTSSSGSIDAFVAKFNPSLSGNAQLVWGTYYGGSGSNLGLGVNTDAAGNVYVTGATTSASGIATAGASQFVYGGGQDAFLSKFNSSGSALLWGTYYGGASVESPSSWNPKPALDANGFIYITGQTQSINNIATAGAFKTSYSGNGDAYVAKFGICPLMPISFTIIDVSCFGGNNGKAIATVTGGTLPYTYVWSPIFGNTNTENSLSAGIYTLVVKDKNGCSSSATITINQPPLLTAAITSTANVLCNGGNTGSATVTAAGGAGGYVYLWNPTGQTNATATGLTAGSYVVTVTDQNGCSASTSVTLTQPPPISAIATNNSSGTECVGTPINLTASVSIGSFSPYFYQWSNGSTATSITPFSTITIPAPANNTTYLVTVRDGHGCTATASTPVSVNPNCCYAANMYGNGQTSTGLPNPYTVTASFSGTFIVNNNFTFASTAIAMGAGAIIDVKPGVTLTITGSTIYACGDMWQGIKVEPGASLVVDKGSVVEDAQEAIEMYASGNNFSNQPNVTVNSSKLNNNYYDIVIDPATTDDGPYHLTLQNCTLTTSSDPYSLNNYLKPPYTPGTITNSGIYLNGMGGAYPVTIGDPLYPMNTFSFMNYGVHAINSGCSVYNNDFHDLDGYGFCALCIHCPPPPCVTNPIGIAVLADASTQPWTDGNVPAGNPYYQIIVGGSGPNQGNTMTNCYRGIDITDYAYPSVTYNNMSNTANEPTPPIYSSKFGDHGIYLKEPAVPQVTYNNIVNFSTGIHLFDFYFSSSTPPPPNVNTNINSNVIGTSGNKGAVNTGILVEAIPLLAICNLCPIFPHPLYINNNKVTNAGYACISLSGALGYIIPAFADINGNDPLQLLPSTNHNDNTDRAGILLNNDQGNITVSNNVIFSPNSISLSPPSAHPYSDPNTHVIGIRAILSTGIAYECNTMDHVGQCMRFEGLCDPSYGYRNEMYYSYDGLALWNNGEIGTQGGPGNPIEDAWHGTFLDAATYVFNSNVSLSPLFVLNTNNDNPLNLWLNLPLGIGYDVSTITTTTGTAPTCPPDICIPCQSPTLGQQQRMQKTVQNAIPYNIYIPETEYINKLAVFGQLNQDTALLNGDTALQNFYASAPNTNMGAIYAIGQALANNNIQLAIVKNKLLVPANNIEQNYKEVYNVMIHTLAMHVDSADSAQYSTLVAIAQQCPLEGGDAVFLARSTLNRLLNTSFIFPDSCDNDIERRRKNRHSPEGETNLTDNNNVKVYPNPANTELNIEVQIQLGEVAHICLYNSIGQLVQCLELQSTLTNLSISNLPSGIYLYRITDNNGNLLKTDKQMIIN